MRFYLLTISSFFCLSLSAQNFLPSHRYIRQQVSSGYFTQKSGTSIPDDLQCITSSEAKTWLNIDESALPTNNRMPWFSELKPIAVGSPLYPNNCDVTIYSKSVPISGDYSSYGTLLYNPGFNPENLNASSFSQLNTTYWTGGNYTDHSKIGPLNRTAISVDQYPDDGKWKYIDADVYAATDRYVYFGIGGVGDFRIFLDKNVVLRTDAIPNNPRNTWYWHILPIFVKAGSHSVKVGVKSYSSTAPVLGFEIYANTEQEIRIANDNGPIVWQFSTAGMGDFQPFCE